MEMTTTDIRSLTIGEKKQFELLTGKSLAAMAHMADPEFLGGPEIMAVLVWLFKRRENPEFALTEVDNWTDKQVLDYLDFSQYEADEDSEVGKD